MNRWNIEHRTSNAQHRKNVLRVLIRRSAFGVRRSMFSTEFIASMRNLEILHEPVEHFGPKNSPSPRPSPQGEGELSADGWHGGRSQRFIAPMHAKKSQGGSP